MRLKIIRYIVFFLLFSIAGQLFYMQVIRGAYFYNLSKRNRIRVVPLEGARGRIMDREGVILADNQLTFNVSVVSQDIEDRRALFDYVASVIRVSPQELNKRFRSRFLTPFTPVVIAEDITRELAVEIEENKFRFPGLMVQETYRRVYPQGSVGSHILGYVGKISRAKIEQLKDYGYTMQSIIGYSGVEEFYDDELRGESGGRQIEINNRGQEVRLLGLRNPTVGKDIVLTVDQRIQDMADEVLLGRRGAVIIMDSDNGEILGLVSSPAYDPNDFVDAALRSKLSDYFQDTQSPLLNRAISGQYPPGSVFKVPVAMAGLESNHIHRNTTFTCPGYYSIGKFRYGCTHVHNDENLVDALKHSCNVYFFQTGLINGSDDVRQFSKLLGLNAKTGVDLPSEAVGSIPSRSTFKGRWYTGDTLNFSIGQGKVLTTPLQLVKMMAVVANRGRLVEPHLIYTIDQQWPKHMAKAVNLPIKPETFDVIEEGLRQVVKSPEGTAHDLDLPDLKSFGKTGTAQAGSGRDHHAWYVGYTRSEKRTISYCVFLEHGGSSHNAVELTKELLIRLQGLGVI